MTIRRLVIGMAGLSLGLSACQQEEAPVVVADGDETEAEGEVLEGTISDEMIPYDAIGRDAAPVMPSLGVNQAPGAAPTVIGAEPAVPAALARPRATSTAPAPQSAPTPEAAQPPASAAEEQDDAGTAED